MNSLVLFLKHMQAQMQNERNYFKTPKLSGNQISHDFFQLQPIALPLLIPRKLERFRKIIDGNSCLAIVCLKASSAPHNNSLGWARKAWPCSLGRAVGGTIDKQSNHQAAIYYSI